MKDYKNKLKLAKERYNNPKITNEEKEFIEQIFPELKESMDEKIRKSLIKSFTNQHSSNFPTPEGFERKDILAWLEKQGEQKPADKVEPKFKVGDIISDGISEVEIININEDKYYVMNGEIENDAHICNWVVYFKDQENWKLVEYKSYSEEDEEKLNSIIEVLGNDSFLVQWLKSLKDRVQPQLKQTQQKLAWSEEDEYQINTILHGLDLKRELYKKEGNQVEEKRYKTQYDWLKSLKDRMQPQPKQDWSIEDNERLLRIHQFIWANRKGDTDEIYQQEQDADWLMTLKPQTKQEWSENDKVHLTNAILAAEKEWGLDSFTAKWLKSLKPQSHWKPSEEQLKMLWNVICYVEDDTNSNFVGGCMLESLYNDLKKL